MFIGIKLVGTRRELTNIYLTRDHISGCWSPVSARRGGAGSDAVRRFAAHDQLAILRPGARSTRSVISVTDGLRSGSDQIGGCAARSINGVRRTGFRRNRTGYATDGAPCIASPRCETVKSKSGHYACSTAPLQVRQAEDSRVELKRAWGEPEVLARRMAGLANSCRGKPALWVVGVDEDGTVHGAAASDFAAWCQKMASEFEGLTGYQRDRRAIRGRHCCRDLARGDRPVGQGGQQQRDRR
jgi:hypothetical protein